MKTSWRWICGAVIGTFCLSAGGIPTDGPENRYQGIPERNVFGLKEVPPSLPTNTEAPPALPKMFLTGITTILGNKIAMFRVQYPARPGQPATEESLMLAEGQRDGAIEVVSIDENAKEVRVNNSGTAMSLNFEKDGLKTAGTGPTGTTPGQTAPATVGLPGTGTNPAASPTSAYGTPARFGLGRTLRLPNAPAPPPMPPTATVTPPPSPAALGAPAAAAQAQAAGVAKQLTPEEEQLLKVLEEKGGHVPQ